MFDKKVLPLVHKLWYMFWKEGNLADITKVSAATKMECIDELQQPIASAGLAGTTEQLFVQQWL